jgi:hypothetical protein
MTAPAPRPKVVVVGGGFGGVQATQKLSRLPVDVTLVDRRNFHLFQPLTYQVATGALSPGEVCYPLRTIFKRRRNVEVLLGEVTGFDLDRRVVHVTPGAGDGGPIELPYDTLIVAGGSSYSYFGHDEMGAGGARGQVARERAGDPRAHPQGVRGGRARARRGAPPRLADVRGRRRRPDRRRDGRADRRAGPRHDAPRLPGGGSARVPRAAAGGGRPRADELPALALAPGRALARAPRRRRRCSSARSSGWTSTR